MKKTWAVAMAAVTAIGLMAAEPAADKGTAAATSSKEQQMEKVGALRGRLMIKLNDMQKTVDSNLNGAQAGYANVQRKQNKMTTSLSKQMQAENAKAGENRDQAFLEDLNRKAQQYNELWSDWNAKDWADYSKQMNEQGQVLGSLRAVFNNLANIEMAWDGAGLDLNALHALLTTIDKKADETKAMAEQILFDLNKSIAKWDSYTVD